MTEQKAEAYYISYEVGWTTTLCPQCQQRQATAHGYLFREARPQAAAFDQRKPVGEVFLHESGDDCTVLAESERSRS